MIAFAVIALLISIFAISCAVGSSLRSNRAIENAELCARIAVILARAVADHDVVEKVIAGTPFETHDDLDRLLLAAGVGEVDLADVLLASLASLDGGPCASGRTPAPGGSRDPFRADPPGAPHQQ